MQRKKDNFLDKIVKKNYNNQIEEVLENKKFDESAKNLLLSMLYKVEASYKDYETVKRDVATKEDYIERIINVIKNNCNMIKIVKNTSEENEILQNRTFFVDKKAKEIICFPIERKLLYCISKISNKDEIIKDKYVIICNTLSNLLNIGNNINDVEPLRDFNGFSWTTIPNEIESIEHNLIYQNLNILVGNGFLKKWINDKEYLIDYLEEFQNKMEANYGEDITLDFIENLKEVSFLLDIVVDNMAKNNFKKEKKQVEEKLNKINDKEQYILDITQKKKEENKKFDKLDKILNNKELLEKEYIKRNSKLELKDKIFSIRVLAEIIIKEKQEIFEKIEEYNELLNPQNYVKNKTRLDEKYKYLKLLDAKNKSLEIKTRMIKIQKSFLECFKLKIEQAETKQDILELFYLLRYYNLLPFDRKNNVNNLKEIQNELEKTKRLLINKAIETKLVIEYSGNRDLNYIILENIFNVRTIALEQLQLKITKEKNKFYIQLFDEKLFEDKIEITYDKEIAKKDFEVKLNKNVKLFN